MPTSIFKFPVQGPWRVDQRGLAGDFRIEKRRMGDADHALYAYPHEYYASWQAELGEVPETLGYFGENLTIEGLIDTEARIGDVFRCGSVRMQVTQPRIPCRKLDARVGKRFSGVFLRSRRVGFYLRVLEGGELCAGDTLELLDRDPGSPSIDEFVRVSHFDYWDIEGLEGLLAARDLMPTWRELLNDKLIRARGADGWFGMREFEVIAREPESDDAISFVLRCARGRSLPSFEGGQYLTVSYRSTPSSPLIHGACALSGDPRDGHSYRITVERLRDAEGQKTNDLPSILHRSLAVGSTLRAAAPNGPFTLAAVAEDCDSLVCYSHGIALAPVLSLIHDWAAYHEQLPLTVVHADAPHRHRRLRAELADLRRSHPQMRVLLQDLQETTGYGIEKGLLGRSLGAAARPFAFLAGPPIFVDTVREALLGVGLEKRQIRSRLGTLTR
ncbi:MAG: MOSC domain-containing protein [Myxococcales bacterium]|nr:MOSC domain-containing protein [Myxococcales bacterium]